MTEAELRVSEQAKRIVSGVLRSGGTAVDATAGNGHDTLFLSQTAGDCGQVLAFDRTGKRQPLPSISVRTLEGIAADDSVTLPVTPRVNMLAKWVLPPKAALSADQQTTTIIFKII